MSKTRLLSGADLITSKEEAGVGEIENTDYVLVYDRSEHALRKSTILNTSIQGLQGVQGVQGIQGEAGTQGTGGDSGENGIQGTQGIQGDLGIQGIAGEGIQGIQGPQGILGIQGAQGTQGTQGLQGNIGQPGTSIRIIGSVINVNIDPPNNPQTLLNSEFPSATEGDAVIDDTLGDLWVYYTGIWTNVGRIAGSQGIQGTQGIQGDLGIQGTQGLQGTKGDQGASINILGSVPDVNVDPPDDPQTTLNTNFPGAVVNDAVIDQTLGDLWVYDGIQWNNVGQIVGPAGNPGSQGIQGIQGLQGEQGIQGFDGPLGLSGPQGIQGVQGLVGAPQEWYVRTTNYTAINGDRIIANSSGGSFTITLPAAPTVGYYVQITDGGDWELNNVTIARNGSTIEGETNDFILDVSNITTEFIYDGSTWQVTSTLGPVGFQGIQGVQGLQGNPGTGAQGLQGVAGSPQEWIVKLTNYTASDGDRIIANTSGGTFTITLPANPGIGYYVQVTDGADWLANNLLIDRNGSTIENLSSNLNLNIAGITVEFIYDGSTWQVTATIGPEGAQGVQGVQGPQGTQGLQGRQGLQGVQGIQGRQGVQGLQGNIGQPGTSISIIGSVPDVNVDPPNNPQTTLNTGFPSAVDGDSVIDDLTGDLWVYYSPSWVNVGRIAGTQGTQGIQGLQGLQGNFGIQGNFGPQGVQGTQGLKGDDGFIGVDGVQGIQGIQGVQGLAAALAPWILVTSTYTAGNNDRIVARTTGGSFTINLPPTPSVGSYVQISDGGQWAVNNLTVARNGSTIEGVADNLTLNITGVTVELIYDGSTWQVTASSNIGAIGATSNINAANDTTTSILYPIMVAGPSSDQPAKVTTTKLYFSASTGDLSATNFNSLSDVSLKTDIVEVEQAIEKIRSFRGVNFKWLDSGRSGMGVIAQEVEKVLPELVNYTPSGKKAVSYNGLIGVLIQAIKHLDEELQKTNDKISKYVK